MGHQRLGTIPTSQSWNTVVGLLGTDVYGGFESPNRLAAATLDAAQPALAVANQDDGFRYTFYLLSQIALASRQPDWLERLQALGIHLSAESSVFDLTSQVQYTLDDYIARTGHPTDISEMAQRAAAEALTSLASNHTIGLFDKGGDELQSTIRLMSTQRGFGELGQRFFGRFMARFLNFYLSRVTAAYVGGTGRPSVGAVTAFNRSLRRHCEESARIVRDYCGEWYSKTEYEHRINRKNTGKFMAHAVTKLSAELRKQRERI